MRRLLLAFQFLTIVPVRVRGDVREEDIAGSAMFFPVVGAAQGLILAGTAMLLLKIFPPDIVAGFVVLVHIALTGGFHMDGLSDTFDALAVKSTGDLEADRDKRLAVMKDPAAGAIGVLSIALAVLLKFLFIRELLIGTQAFTALFLMPVLSKWAVLSMIKNGRPARKDGLGRVFMSGIRLSYPTAIAAALALSASALSGMPLALPVLLSVALYISGLAALWLFEGKFGGITGDNMGAMAEVSEIIFLSGAYIWLRHFI